MKAWVSFKADALSYKLIRISNFDRVGGKMVRRPRACPAGIREGRKQKVLVFFFQHFLHL